MLTRWQLPVAPGLCVRALLMPGRHGGFAREHRACDKLDLYHSLTCTRFTCTTTVVSALLTTCFEAHMAAHALARRHTLMQCCMLPALPMRTVLTCRSYMPGRGRRTCLLQQSVLQQAADGALAVTAQARQPQCCSRVPECQYMQVPSRDVLRTREVRALSCHERQ